MGKPAPSREKGNFSLRSFGVFLLVGGFATALHYVLMAGLIALLGIQAVPASATGFAISAVVNYLLTARLTFRSKQAHTVTAPRFVVVAGTGLGLNALLLSLLLPGLHLILAQLLTTIGVLIWNYSINGLWTFKDRAC